MPLRISRDANPPPCTNCGAVGQVMTQRRGRTVSWCGVCDPHCPWCLRLVPKDEAEAEAHMHRCSAAAMKYFGFDRPIPTERWGDLDEDE